MTEPPTSPGDRAAAAVSPLPAPQTAEEPALRRLVDQVRAAASDGSAVRIRGAGSKDFYGGALTGALLDTRELRGICSYEPTEMVISARAGTPLAELEAALAEHGQCLAFEPPRYGADGTVGGMVAAGLAGPARASVGCVRDFLLGAVLLNGRAEVLRFGGQVMKNVAGYDVARVLPGSLGVLGVLCEVSLKVLPVAPATATLHFECSQAGAIELVQRWLLAALPVNASAWEADRLHLRLAGAAAAVRTAAARLAVEHGGRALEEGAARQFWIELRDQRCAYFARAIAALGADGAARELRLWRIGVPANRPPLALAGPTLVEWGGAQRWLLTEAPIVEVRKAAQAAGGHASIVRAVERPADFQAELPDILMQFHKSLKQAFDPKQIFNRGRLYSWL
jgi:glycolate oxidase FAD binding subunit